MAPELVSGLAAITSPCIVAIIVFAIVAIEVVVILSSVVHFREGMHDYLEMC